MNIDDLMSALEKNDYGDGKTSQEISHAHPHIPADDICMALFKMTVKGRIDYTPRYQNLGIYRNVKGKK